MKIYLINLDRHPDRLAHMRKQFDGVAFERIAAVDGSNAPPTTRGLSRFELACLESHRIAWRELLNSPEDSACIFEDDLHIWPGLATLTRKAAWCPRTPIRLSSTPTCKKSKLGEKQPARSASREIARLYTRHQSSSSLYRYPRGCGALPGFDRQAPLPADYALFPRHPRRLGLRIYQLTPAIAIQDHLLKPSRHQPLQPQWPALPGAHHHVAPP